MKYFINNAKEQQICVNYEHNDKNSKLAFVCHGIASNKSFSVIRVIAQTLYDNDYNVITFDCRNCVGESHSDMKCAVLSDFCEDLQTVIDWAKEQSFYKEKFLLAGHSYGGSTVLDYAIKNSDEVDKVLFVSGAINGEMLNQLYITNRTDFYHQLCNGGTTYTNNDKSCFLDDSFIKASYDYDFLKLADKITMPILQVMGDTNETSTFENNKKLHNIIKSEKKKIAQIKNCTHHYTSIENEADLAKDIKDFIL